MPRRRTETISRFRAQHADMQHMTIGTAQGFEYVAANQLESPLVWLARRKLIEPLQLQAGERLRRDFTAAHLAPRVTSNWDTAGACRPRFIGVALAETIIAARQRINQALDAAGPEFSGLLLDVCCFLKGLADVERERRWPQRSAKIVLQLGLDRLARHYGLANEARGPAYAPMRACHFGEKAEVM